MKSSQMIGLGIIGLLITVVINGALLIGAIWLIIKCLHWFGILH